MKIHGIVSLFGLLALVAHADPGSPDRVACPNFAGLYKGACTTHWPSGQDYKSEQYLRIRQRTVSGPTNGKQLMYGEHCASVTMLRFSGDSPERFSVISNDDFQIYEAEHASDMKTVVDGDSTTQTQAVWHPNRSALFIKRNDMGGVDGMGTMTRSHLLAYKLSPDQPNTLLIQDQSLNREPDVTQSCVLIKTQ